MIQLDVKSRNIKKELEISSSTMLEVIALLDGVFLSRFFDMSYGTLVSVVARQCGALLGVVVIGWTTKTTNVANVQLYYESSSHKLLCKATI